MNSRIDLGIVTSDGAAPRHERADAAANRKLILATAEDLFAAQGVAAVAMADIAQAAGVGKGTLYRRFANKPELCLALMHEQMLAFQNNIFAGLHDLKINGVSNLEQLAYFLDDLVHFTDRHLPLLCEVERAGLLETGHNRELPHIWQHMTVKGLLKAAVQAGELSDQVDIEYTADVLIAPLRIPLFRFQREGKGFSLARISAGLQSIAAALAKI